MESRGDGLRSSNPTLNRRGSNSSLHAGKCGSTPNLPIILSVFFFWIDISVRLRPLLDVDD